MIDCGRYQADAAPETVYFDKSMASTRWKRYISTENASRSPANWLKRITIPRDDHFVVLTVRRNRTAEEAELNAAGEQLASRQTVYKQLIHHGLFASYPVICAPLTSRPKSARYQCRKGVARVRLLIIIPPQTCLPLPLCLCNLLAQQHSPYHNTPTVTVYGKPGFVRHHYIASVICDPSTCSLNQWYRSRLWRDVSRRHIVGRLA